MTLGIPWRVIPGLIFTHSFLISIVVPVHTAVKELARHLQILHLVKTIAGQFLWQLPTENTAGTCITSCSPHEKKIMGFLQLVTYKFSN